jgi:glutathione S-transferase
MTSFGNQILENDEKFSQEKGDYYLGGHFTMVDIALIPWYTPISFYYQGHPHAPRAGKVQRFQTP